MGIVYRATQLALGRPVALKLLTAQFAADEGFRERFRREWETAAAIDHPNVIPLYEAGESATGTCSSRCASSTVSTSRT